MAYDANTRNEIFRRLGVYVRWWYDLDAMKETLDGLLEEAIDDFEIDNGSDEDKVSYEAFSAEIARQKQELDSMRYSVASLVSDYLGVKVKVLLDSPYSSADAILDHLIDLMNDPENDDTVRPNDVGGEDSMDEDPDNSVAVGDTGLPTFEVTQMAKNDDFVLTCVDDSIVDQERWTLESGLLGQSGSEVVTAEAADWVQAGIKDLTIAAAPTDDIEAPTGLDDKITEWNLSGATRGTHTAEDGRVWLEFHDKPGSIEKANDELDQVTDWDFTSTDMAYPPFGAESDSDGKVHVSVVQDVSAYTVYGGDQASLDATGIDLDDVGDDTTTGYFWLTVTHTPASGDLWDYDIEIYSDSDRTSLVASGSESGVADADLPVEIVVDPASDHTLNGTVTLDAFDSEADSGEDSDSTLAIQVPSYAVRLYRSETRSAGDLIAEGVCYDPVKDDLSLDAQGEFETTATVDLAYLQDNESIELTMEYYKVDLYRADPEDGATEADIVARAGDPDTDLLTEAAADLEFYPVNDSGLTGVTIDLASGDSISDGDVISGIVGFAAGDKFTFSTTVDTEEEGRFQTFLRDCFEKVFPAEEGSAPEHSVNEQYAGGTNVGPWP